MTIRFNREARLDFTVYDQKIEIKNLPICTLTKKFLIKQKILKLGDIQGKRVTDLLQYQGIGGRGVREVLALTRRPSSYYDVGMVGVGANQSVAAELGQLRFVVNGINERLKKVERKIK